MGGGGRLLLILSLRRGANSKRGAYLKLSANSSIYGIPMFTEKNKRKPKAVTALKWRQIGTYSEMINLRFVQSAYFLRTDALDDEKFQVGKW